MRKTPEEERNTKKRTCIFTSHFTLGQFSVSACVNKPPGFSGSGTSTLNELFQTINGLKNLNGLHQTALLTITGCIVPFKNRKSWTFC